MEDILNEDSLLKRRNEPTTPRRDIQSVDRALSILEAIAKKGGEAALSDLAAQLRLNVSTCHHLISTLVARGYVVKGSRRGSYSLGPQVLVLSGRVNWQDDLPRRAEPAMDQLNQETGEAVHFAVLRGDELVTLVKRDALHALRVDTTAAGKTVACHATATGKAILAWMAKSDVQALLKRHGMQRFTKHTITRQTALLKELAEIRRTGIAMDWEEFQPHVVCLGAAIHDHTGAVVGAISVSTPTPRVDDAHVARVREAVSRTAHHLSTGAPRLPESSKNSKNHEDPTAREKTPRPQSKTQTTKRKRTNG